MKVSLKKLSTLPPDDLSKEEAQIITEKNINRLVEYHEMLKAEKKHALLIIFQGIDGSGKDGALNNVLGKCSHSGTHVIEFKKPTEEEFAHDFLWRVHAHAPKKGQMTVFIRSHYEDVLIQRVHEWIDEDRVDARFDAINAWETLLVKDNNTHILKFFLNISKEQQEKELNQRLTEPDKFYKHNANDWKEREYWDRYMFCYEEVINRSIIPWHIIGTDKRWFRDYQISQILVEYLSKIGLQYPPLKKDAPG